MNTRLRLQWLALLSVAAAPLLLVLAVLAFYEVPVPILDDYHLLLAFALDLHQTHTLGQHLYLDITAQHGEYRMMLLHLLVDAQLATLGHIDLQPFIWAGNLIFFPILGLLWLAFPLPGRTRIERFAFFLPAVFLVATLVYTEQLDWMEGILYYISPLALATILALVFATEPGRSRKVRAWAFGAGLLLLCISSLLSAQGFLLVPIGLVILSLRKALNWRTGTLWTLVPVPILVAYLFRYQPVPHPLTPSLPAQLIFLLSFLGGAVENMHHRPVPYVATILGGCILLGVAYATYRRAYRSSLALYCFSIWCLLTALLTAHVRSDMGLQQSLSSRYKIYSMQMLAVAYLYIAKELSGRRPSADAWQSLWYRGTLLVAIVLSLSGTVVGADFLKRRHDGLLAGVAWYRADPEHHSPLTHMGQLHDEPPDRAIAGRNALNAVSRLGIYRLPND